VDLFSFSHYCGSGDSQTLSWDPHLSRWFSRLDDFAEVDQRSPFGDAGLAESPIRVERSTIDSTTSPRAFGT
jgi:hypothetical protein